MIERIPVIGKSISKKHLVPIVSGAISLIFAGMGEWLMRGGGTLAPNIPPGPNATAGMLLYAIAVIIFVLSALTPPKDATYATNADSHQEKPRKVLASLILILAGIISSVAIGWFSFNALSKNIKSPDGALLWCLSMITLLAFCLAGSSALRYAPRWNTQIGPASCRRRALLNYALIVLLVVVVATRLFWLDAIPIGINPDEGDRASNAIAVLRGTTSQAFFQSGWYRISMVYFSILGAFMRITGPGYMQSRWFHALCSIATAGFVTLIGIRNFNWRTGLIAGFVLSGLGIAIQFGRVTTEATPTALLWTMSVFFFLEGARHGLMWAWVAAGLSGGFSIYFYPQGRLWAALAALWCVYAFLHGFGRKRSHIVLGATLAAISAVIVVMPFFVNIKDNFWEFSRRFEETGAFVGTNATRLPYYNSTWSSLQFFGEQLRRSLFVFNQFADGGGIWPHGRPILQPGTTILTLLGLGWSSLKWRDPRYVMLSLWFWVGISGMVITVETPNVQRMATSIPVIALFIAVVLDELIRRIELAFSQRRNRLRWLIPATTIAYCLIVSGLMATELKFYFADYAKMDLWRPWNAEADAAVAQGTDTRVITLERSWFMIKSGWTNLKALDVPRFGIKSPGTMLPLTLPADKNLAFLVYSHQPQYLPYLQSIYPSAVTKIITDTSMPASNRLLFWMVRVPQASLASSQGAIVQIGQNIIAHVSSIGELPQPQISFNTEARLTWRAGLRITRSWNYAFRAPDAAASLTIDGIKISLNPQKPVFLPQGDHYLVFESSPGSPDKSLLEWTQTNGIEIPENSVWQQIPSVILMSDQFAPRGLLGEVEIEKQPLILRLDNTLADCCVGEINSASGRPFLPPGAEHLTRPNLVYLNSGSPLMALENLRLTIFLLLPLTATKPAAKPISQMENMRSRSLYV